MSDNMVEFESIVNPEMSQMPIPGTKRRIEFLRRSGKVIITTHSEPVLVKEWLKRNRIQCDEVRGWLKSASKRELPLNGKDERLLRQSPEKTQESPNPESLQSPPQPSSEEGVNGKRKWSDEHRKKFEESIAKRKRKETKHAKTHTVSQ